MNRARPKQIVIRASESELEAIKLKVKESKLNQNEYIIHCLLNKDIIVIDGLRDITVELKRIGNNLNQLTKLAHEGKIDCSAELEEINGEMKGVWQSLRQLIQEQGET